MDVKDRVAVVTGGASGIGRSLCRALAARGAAAVVVSDLDGPGAEAVAAELSGGGGGGAGGGGVGGTQALAVRTDVAKEDDIVSLVKATEEAFGPVDLFFSNAGIIAIGGVEVPDDAWDRIWDVNVKSHIYAARALLPSWRERGEGYLVITASAAGLLAQLGSAPYSVTKHAAVSLAEWLSITHGDEGIRVSCLCPQAVWTGMAGAPKGGDSDMPSVRGAAAGPGEANKGTAASDGIIRPEEVADLVLDTVAEEGFLILPHPQVATYEQRRAGDRERWLKGMRRAQAAISGLRRAGGQGS